MASPSSPQHEPTMEEILASIRKIISEDSNESQPASQPAHASAQDADVLELTQEVQELPAPAPAAPPAPVLAAAPTPVRPSDEVVFQSIEEAQVNVVAQTPSPSSEGIVSEKARRAIDDALAGIDFGSGEPATAPAPAAAAPRAVPPVDGRSVEAVFDRAVRETVDPVLRAWLNEQGDAIVERMKPALREWMEQRLPDMLKAAVEEEVARAVRSRAKR